MLRLASLLVVSPLAFGCGANVSKTYESDVRFERCYSLDWGDVDPVIRKRCWEQWAEHYAEGQPLDRVAFAKRQINLGATEGVSSAELAVPTTQGSASPAAPQPGQALPQPTSVFVPVPMMAKPEAFASASVTATPAPRTPCEERCDRSMEACLGGCASPVCEGFCAQKHTRCGTKCASTLEQQSKGASTRR